MFLISSLVPFASQVFPRLSSRVLASSGYTLDPSRIGGPDAFAVWTARTARRQDRAWQPIVDEARAGRPREDVASLFDALSFLTARPATVLEVGCGGGYNSEIIGFRFPALDYSGIDLSAAMVDIAHDRYPNSAFVVGSAYDLPVEDKSFDVVMDGVALIHMLGWRLALAEYARAARGHVILHGLTLADSSPTTTFAKYAYGQPAMELVFNRAELTSLCIDLGLTLQTVHVGLDYDLQRYLGVSTASETWVLSTEGP